MKGQSVVSGVGRAAVVSRERSGFSFDPMADPVATVAPGSELVVETHDARGGRLTSPDKVLETAPNFGERFPRTNPATGPIHVSGAEPGDVLEVEILSIELAERGFVLIKPDVGTVRQVVDSPAAKFCRIIGETIEFEHLRLKCRPMVGVLAVAPADGPIATAMVGRFGGNLDCARITVGARVFLPVQVPGAKLYIGDLHAAMGDGEISGTGLEIPGRVSLAIRLHPRLERIWPWMETVGELITLASDRSFEIASEIAVACMTELVCDRTGLAKSDAVMLLSLVGELRINQACRSATDISVRCEVPKYCLAYSDEQLSRKLE
jgi:amidase